VIGFDSKLKMTNIAMQALCREHPQVLATWNNLENRIKSKSKIRNKLAHGAVVCKHKPVESVAHPGVLDGCWFIPYFGMLREKQSVFGFIKTGTSAAEKLTADDLRKIADRFLTLAGCLQRLFLDDVVGITSGKKK
jgi:hypothetical protein